MLNYFSSISRWFRVKIVIKQVYSLLAIEPGGLRSAEEELRELLKHDHKTEKKFSW